MAQQQLSTNTFGVARWIVSATASDGTHTTIAAALTAASSGDTIFIRDGTYTEDPTLKAGVNLAAFDCDALTPNVTIVGKCTFTAAGTVSISGIRLQTNSDFCLAVTGSAASIVNLKDCYINALNNAGISFTSSSASAKIALTNCQGDIGTTGIAFFTHSSAGNLNFDYTSISNTGASTTAATISAGVLNLSDGAYAFPVTTSSTAAMTSRYNRWTTLATNTTILTVGGSGANNSWYDVFLSGTASSISVGSALTLLYADVYSSNTNAITGAGTLTYGGVVFSSSSSTINTSVQTPIPWPVKQGGTGLSATTTYAVLCGGTTTTGALQSIASVGTSGQVLVSNGAGALPTFQASSGAGSLVLLLTQNANNSASISFSSTYITSTYKTYLLVLNAIVPASQVVIYCQVSTNNGSTYVNSGYIAGYQIVAYNSATFGNASYTANFVLTGSVDTTAGYGMNGYVFFQNPLNGLIPTFDGTLQMRSTAPDSRLALTSGWCTTTNVNNIQFYGSSGNITLGTFSLYGVVQ